ncbi:aldehyde dehydrogenase family protein, partial [Mesorhizobium sp.]
MSAHLARTNRHEALDGLSDRRLLRALAYVDSHWTASEAAESFAVTDPATGSAIAFVAALDAGQTTKAIDAASRAFPAWRALLPQERSKILRKWFELIVAAKEDLALLMTLE